MKTTIDFGIFAQDAITFTEMNFLRGGSDPDKGGNDLIVPPTGEGR